MRAPPMVADRPDPLEEVLEAAPVEALASEPLVVAAAEPAAVLPVASEGAETSAPVAVPTMGWKKVDWEPVAAVI